MCGCGAMGRGCSGRRRSRGEWRVLSVRLDALRTSMVTGLGPVAHPSASFRRGLWRSWELLDGSEDLFQIDCQRYPTLIPCLSRAA